MKRTYQHQMNLMIYFGCWIKQEDIKTVESIFLFHEVSKGGRRMNPYIKILVLKPQKNILKYYKFV